MASALGPGATAAASKASASAGRLQGFRLALQPDGSAGLVAGFQERTARPAWCQLLTDCLAAKQAAWCLWVQHVIAPEGSPDPEHSVTVLAGIAERAVWSSVPAAPHGLPGGQHCSPPEPGWQTDPLKTLPYLPALMSSLAQACWQALRSVQYGLNIASC